jgi:hypothetical protein
VRAARFEAALETTAALRARLGQTPQSATRTGLVVDTEVVAATTRSPIMARRSIRAAAAA